MSNDNIQSIERAINCLAKENHPIRLRDVIEFARQKFGFDGSIVQVFNRVMESSNFSLVERFEPETSSHIWYVVVCRHPQLGADTTENDETLRPVNWP